MIESNVLSLLENTAALTTLLSSTTAIYTVVAPQGAVAPYLEVGFAEGPVQELIREQRVDVKIVASNAGQLQNIRNRLDLLLNTANDIRAAASDTTYRLFHSRQTGTSGQYTDPDTKEYIEVLIYSILYTKL